MQVFAYYGKGAFYHVKQLGDLKLYINQLLCSIRGTAAVVNSIKGIEPGMEHKNLAVELLRKLIDGEIKIRARKNVVLARSFTELLENAIAKYHNRAIETIQVIDELISIAKTMREASNRGDKLGLSEDEIAFYDALGVNDSAVAVLGDDRLRKIAQEIAKSVRNNVKIDWAIRENVRAEMRVIVKRILRKYGYPPDKQAQATELVLEQAELICREEDE